MQITLADVVSTLQSKGLVNFVNIKDLLETKISTLSQESVETISRFTVEQEKAVADIFNTSDNVEDLLAGRNYKEIINAIDYVAKEQKLIMHRGIGGTVRYPLAEIAIAMSHPISTGGVNNLQQGLKPTADFGSGYSNANWPLNDRNGITGSINIEVMELLAIPDLLEMSIILLGPFLFL